MKVELITVEHLEAFRIQLINDLRAIVGEKTQKKWIKTQEVLDLLDISDVTLLKLRNSGIIPYKKLGGVCYYNVDELNDVMSKL